MMSPFLRNGTAFVLCAPSGTGKTTLIKLLLERYDRLAFSISCTTRKPRQGEVEGKDYYFTSNDVFQNLAGKGYFAEWAEVHGNYYGTPLVATRELLAVGKDILFDVDIQGAAQLKKTLPEAYFCFILPPSRQELERRLRSRKTDNESAISLRLTNAAKEIREAEWFDAWIVNDDMDKAFADLCAVYRTSCLSPQRRKEFFSNLMEQF